MKKENVAIASPDALNKHLQHSSPLTWVTLGSVIAIILGFFVWSGIYKLPIKLSGLASVANGQASLTVEEKAKEKLEVGTKVYILDQVGELSFDEEGDPIVLNLNLGDGQYTYRTDIVIAEMRPIQYLFN